MFGLLLVSDPLMFLQNLVQQNHRALLVLSGELAWCWQSVDGLLGGESHLRSSFSSLLIVTEQPELVPSTLSSQINIQSLAASRKNLGREFSTVVYCGFDGINPDTLASLAGSVKGGGLLVLLVPALEQLASFVDPEYKNILVYPNTDDQPEGYYLQFLANNVTQDNRILLWRQGQELKVPEGLKALAQVSGESATDVQFEYGAINSDQQSAVEKIVRVALGKHSKRPLVLTADRGRGKTSALGLAVSEICRQVNSGKADSRTEFQVIVTAYQASAVEPLFYHLQQQLAVERVEKDFYRIGKCSIRFLSLSQLQESDHVNDLLLVDEAATLPVFILEKLLHKHSRICFATTVDGYEGTGRGFQLKFLPKLKQLRPQSTQFELTSPVRWAEGDPLEAWINDICFLKLAEEKVFSEKDVVESSAELSIQVMTSQYLAAHPDYLQKIMGLLTLAHYRTSPGDARSLLDGNNLKVIVALQQESVVGVVFLALEGGLPQSLAQNIWEGKRRPRGHLLPQSMAVHLGERSFLHKRFLRVIRIAVSPVKQLQGIGRQLLGWVDNYAEQENIDYVGTSFSLTPEVISFWSCCGYQLMRLGLQKENTSGCHSALMIKAVNAELDDSELSIQQMQLGFEEWFLLQLTRDFQRLDIELVLAVFKSLANNDAQTDIALSQYELGLLQSFVQGQGFIESSLVPLVKVLRYQLGNVGYYDDGIVLPIHKLLQNKSWKELVPTHKLGSRKQGIDQIREWAKHWMNECSGLG